MFGIISEFLIWVLGGTREKFDYLLLEPVQQLECVGRGSKCGLEGEINILARWRDRGRETYDFNSRLTLPLVSSIIAVCIQHASEYLKQCMAVYIY